MIHDDARPCCLWMRSCNGDYVLSTSAVSLKRSWLTPPLHGTSPFCHASAKGLLKVSTDQTLAGQFDISWLKAMLRSKLLEIQFEVAARPTKSQRSHITHGIKCRRIDSTRDYDRLKANVGKCMEAPQRMACKTAGAEFHMQKSHSYLTSTQRGV